MTPFFRFPSTPHLAWLGAGSPRGDTVLEPAAVRTLLRHELVGIVVRHDEGEWSSGRAKLVRREFVASIEEHWSRRRVEPNRLDPVRGGAS